MPVFKSGPVSGNTALSDGGFAIYVHWPFCLAKCPYCDFNSHVREQIDESGWCDALLAELAYFAGQTPGRTVDSIFFGGGTPSLMSPATVGRLIDAMANHWAFSSEVEITLEANPTSVEASKFAGFARAGVNRLSMGVQALNDSDLAFLGREHSAAEALAAFEVARQHFGRISFDLIYGRPGQSVSGWSAELSQAMDLAAGHLSLYQLTIEEGTAFHTAWRHGTLTMPSDDMGADLFNITRDLTADAGLPAYEVSNHARPGEECRHNLVYWRYGDYVGVGPGAHGRITRDGVRVATAQRHKPESWVAAVREKGHGSVEDTPLDARTSAEEMLMMGLRLTEGVDIPRLERVAGTPLKTIVNAKSLHDLVDEGLLVTSDHRLSASADGLMVLNAVTGALLS
jgi:putative oxygen-independent coproporphyrinogen III oxidase